MIRASNSFGLCHLNEIFKAKTIELDPSTVQLVQNIAESFLKFSSATIMGNLNPLWDTQA